MNTADIENFMRRVGQGDFDPNQVKAFSTRAADALKTMREKLPVWRAPEKLRDAPSGIIFILNNDHDILTMGHIADNAVLVDKFLGWMPITDLIKLDVEKKDGPRAA